MTVRPWNKKKLWCAPGDNPEVLVRFILIEIRASSCSKLIARILFCFLLCFGRGQYHSKEVGLPWQAHAGSPPLPRAQIWRVPPLVCPGVHAVSGATRPILMPPQMSQSWLHSMPHHDWAVPWHPFASAPGTVAQLTLPCYSTGRGCLSWEKCHIQSQING